MQILPETVILQGFQRLFSYHPSKDSGSPMQMQPSLANSSILLQVLVAVHNLGLEQRRVLVPQLGSLAVERRCAGLLSVEVSG